MYAAPSFEEVYAEQRERVYRVLLRLTCSYVDAEDLTSETFISVWKGLANFKGESSVATWVYRIAVNTYLMSLRKRKLTTVPLLGIDVDDGAAREVSTFLAQEDTALRSLPVRLALQKALAQLSPNANRKLGYRKVVELHALAGYEHAEIAHMTGTTIGNSKSQYHKAKRRLAEILSC